MDSLKSKRELKEKRKREQNENVKRKLEKKGELPEEDEKKKDDEAEEIGDDDDIKDEGEDQRIIGKRSREEQSNPKGGEATKRQKTNKTPVKVKAAAPEKPILKTGTIIVGRGQSIIKAKNHKAIRNPKLIPGTSPNAPSKSSRPATKEARLKKLGKFIGDKGGKSASDKKFGAKPFAGKKTAKPSGGKKHGKK